MSRAGLRALRVVRGLLSYFSGNSTLSHSGCSRRFSISLRRNSESLDGSRTVSPKFLLIEGPAFSQASTSAYATSCSRLGSDLLFLNRSSTPAGRPKMPRHFFMNSAEGRGPRVAGCSPLRTMTRRLRVARDSMHAFPGRSPKTSRRRFDVYVGGNRRGVQNRGRFPP